MKAILVTGGAGYIGSHTCKALSAAGHRPVVLDNLSTGHRSAVRWGPLIEGDIADRRLVSQTLEKYQIDAVIHFAANASVGESMVNPFKYLFGNVAGSVTLLEAMSDAGVGRIVFSSTCATYGAPESSTVSETQAQAPVNPYGESKLFVERALGWYQRAYGLGWVALRYFNAAGADRDGEIGEWHEPETHLIPSAIQAVLELRPAVHIMGTDYPTPDGTAIRDTSTWKTSHPRTSRRLSISRAAERVSR
jgi:UDP-arabinose 4-epimerase